MWIEEFAFQWCESLTRISLCPDISIDEDCFSECTALISAAAAQNMPTVEDLLNYRWHREPAVIERATVLFCLKTLLEDQPGRSDGLKRKHLDGGEGITLGVNAERLPKDMWRVILEFL
jgi:hypothetical protein